MAAQDHGPQIKDDEQYSKLRQKGYSKEKAARIANSSPSEQDTSKMGTAYEDWTKDELYDKAREVGIDGRSDMTKDELIEALRS